MDEIIEFLAAHITLCAKAGVEPLPKPEIEGWLRACLADNIIGRAAVHRLGNRTRPRRSATRCRMQGGKAERPPTHGRYTSAAIEDRRGLGEALRVLPKLIGKAGRKIAARNL